MRYLIYYEQYENVYDAMGREKELKKWRREKKMALIRQDNHNLDDLSEELFESMGIGEEEIKGVVGELEKNYRGQ